MKIMNKIIVWCVIMTLLNILVIIFMNSNELNLSKWLMFVFSSVGYSITIIDIIRNEYDNYSRILYSLVILSCVSDLFLFMVFSITVLMDNPNELNILITSLKYIWFGCLFTLWMSSYNENV